MDSVIAFVVDVLQYGLGVLEIAWGAFAQTMRTDVAAVLKTPAMITIASLFVVGYAVLLARSD